MGFAAALRAAAEKEQVHSVPVALRALDGLVAGPAAVEELAERMSAEGTVVDAEGWPRL